MKKVVLFIITLLIITGCNKTEKIYLSDKYYNEGNYISVKNLDGLEKDSYVLYTYNYYCSFKISCEKVFKEYMNKYKIDFISMPFEYLKKTQLYKKVKFGPSIVIVKEGKVIAYLDADKDEDLEKYQDSKKFEEWINNYIYTEGSN